MEEYPGNSHRAKNTEGDEKAGPKKVEKVVTGKVIRRKTTLGTRFRETFGGGDARGVLEAVIFEVLIPAGKDMFLDALHEGAERMIRGESRSSGRRSGGRSSGSNGHTNYNRLFQSSSSNRYDEPRNNISRRGRATHNFDEIILATRAEAEEVLQRLLDLISQYDSASVADLYSLVDEVPSFTDEKWGWTNKRDILEAQPVRVRSGGGYQLGLPKAELLD